MCESYIRAFTQKMKVDIRVTGAHRKVYTNWEFPSLSNEVHTIHVAILSLKDLFSRYRQGTLLGYKMTKEIASCNTSLISRTTDSDQILNASEHFFIDTINAQESRNGIEEIEKQLRTLISKYPELDQTT